MHCLSNIQDQLLHKLQRKPSDLVLSPREKEILRFIEAHPASGSGKIAAALELSLRTVQQVLTEMLKKDFVEKAGVGKVTTYSAL